MRGCNKISTRYQHTSKCGIIIIIQTFPAHGKHYLIIYRLYFWSGMCILIDISEYERIVKTILFSLNNLASYRRYEANIPTQPAETQKYAWFSRTDENKRWPESPGPQAGEGPLEADGERRAITGRGSAQRRVADTSEIGDSAWKKELRPGVPRGAGGRRKALPVSDVM